MSASAARCRRRPRSPQEIQRGLQACAPICRKSYFGVIATTATWLSIAVSESPGFTRDSWARPSGVVTLKVRIWPPAGLTSEIVLADGLTAVTHQVATAWSDETPAALVPVPAATVTLTSRSRGVLVLGPESTKVSLSSKPTDTLSPTLVCAKLATEGLTL